MIDSVCKRIDVELMRARATVITAVIIDHEGKAVMKTVDANGELKAYEASSTIALKPLFKDLEPQHPVIMMSSEADYARFGEGVGAVGTFAYGFDYNESEEDIWGFEDRRVLIIPALQDVENEKNALIAGRSQQQGEQPEVRYQQARAMLARWGVRVNVLGFDLVEKFIHHPERTTRSVMDVFLHEKTEKNTLQLPTDYLQILGYTESGGKIKYHLFSHYTKREILINQANMNASGFMELAKNAPMSYWHDKKLNPLFRVGPKDERLSAERKIEHYMRFISDQCIDKGIKQRYQILRQGAWELKYENGQRERVYHLGSRLLNKKLLPRAFGVVEDEYMLFACNGLGKLIEESLTRDETDEMEKYLTRREWEDPLSPVYIMGAIYASTLSGILGWRPHLWVNAPFASGKSAISDALVDLLGDGKGCFFAAGDKTTESGIRRGTDGKAFMVVYEEAEGETTNGLDQIILLARSSSDGKPIKQTNKDSHEEDTFTCHCMFMMFSIGNNLRRAADQSRFITLNLKKSGGDQQKMFRELDGIRHRYWNMRMGRRIHYDAYKNATKYLGLVEVIKDELGGDRHAKNVAPLLAGYMMMKKESSMEYLDELMARAKATGKESIMQKIEVGTDNDIDEFKGLLLNQEVQLEIDGVTYTKALSTWILYLTRQVRLPEVDLELKHEKVVMKLAEKDAKVRDKDGERAAWELIITSSSPLIRKPFAKSELRNKIKTMVLALGGWYNQTVRVSSYRVAKGMIIPVNQLLEYKNPTDEEAAAVQAMEEPTKEEES